MLFKVVNYACGLLGNLSKTLQFCNLLKILDTFKQLEVFGSLGKHTMRLLPFLISSYVYLRILHFGRQFVNFERFFAWQDCELSPITLHN